MSPIWSIIHVFIRSDVIVLVERSMLSNPGNKTTGGSHDPSLTITPERAANGIHREHGNRQDGALTRVS